MKFVSSEPGSGLSFAPREWSSDSNVANQTTSKLHMRSLTRQEPSNQTCYSCFYFSTSCSFIAFPTIHPWLAALWTLWACLVLFSGEPDSHQRARVLDGCLSTPICSRLFSSSFFRFIRMYSTRKRCYCSTCMHESFHSVFIDPSSYNISFCFPPPTRILMPIQAYP